MDGTHWKVRIHYRPGYPHDSYVTERNVWVPGFGGAHVAIAKAQQVNHSHHDIERVEIVETDTIGRPLSVGSKEAERGE